MSDWNIGLVLKGLSSRSTILFYSTQLNDRGRIMIDYCSINNLALMATEAKMPENLIKQLNESIFEYYKLNKQKCQVFFEKSPLEDLNSHSNAFLHSAFQI